MIRVALETSTRVGSVAVGRDGDVLAEVTLGAQRRHAEALIPALDEALRTAGLGRRDIGGVVVGAGPGSFTGVRVAGATAKGLAGSLGVPMLAYSSLLAMAAAAEAGPGVPAVGVVDARRGEVYCGCWVVGGPALVEVLAPVVGAVGRVVEMAVRGIRARAEVGVEVDVEGGDKDEVVVVGEALERYRAELMDAVSGAGLRARWGDGTAAPRACALLALARRYPAAGAVADPGSWEPLYVRGSSAERGVRG